MRNDDLPVLLKNITGVDHAPAVKDAVLRTGIVAAIRLVVRKVHLKLLKQGLIFSGWENGGEALPGWELSEYKDVFRLGFDLNPLKRFVKADFYRVEFMTGAKTETGER